MERRLAAIMAADVVGYSRLIRADEEGTIAALKALRADLIDPTLHQHNGRIVKLMGDGMLAEFASVVDAVRAAVAIQVAVAEHNTDSPNDKRIEFRVGINLGDVVIDGDDIHGDGVNVAARLEGIAEPGGICISSSAHEQVRDKMDIAFDDMGEVEVKNIVRPVRMFRVLREGETVAQAVRPKPRLRIAAAAVALVILITGGGLWWWQSRPDFEPADPAKMAFTLPKVPSIAVLPFDNLSGDPAQDYFADGMSEDLITDLSKLSGLFVISRNSSFSYKGQQVKVRQVAEELGVRYVLEGSVRRAGDEVRINAQLIDATTGGHLWAERYDGSLADVFDLQDEVTTKIVAALAVNLTAGEQAERVLAETTDPRAYDAFLQGRAHYRRWNIDAFGKAVPFFKRALELDPGYSHAHAALAAIYWQSWRRWGERGKEWPPGMGVKQANYYVALDIAKEHLEKAMRLPTPLAHQVAAKMHLKGRRYEEAIAEAKRAVVHDPGDADAQATLAYVLVFGGEAQQAAAAIARAMRLDPHYPPNYLATYGIVTFALGDLAGAAELLARSYERNPEDKANVPILVSALMQIGREPEGRRLFDNFDSYTHSIRSIYPFWPFKDLDVLERFARGWVAAGVCCLDELEELLRELRALQSNQ
jgi:TolB-like protein/class 3 adenylate cyclase